MTKQLQTATTARGQTGTPSLGSYLQTTQAQEEFAKLLPQHFTGERFVRMCLTQARMVRGLANCNFPSVMKCMMECASLGLDPGRHYHFVPFKGECTGIIDWKGLVVLMTRHPDVSDVWADVVYEGDEFEEISGLNRDLVHKKPPPAERVPGRKIVATYAVARFVNGNRTFVVCTEEDFQKAKASSQTASRGYGPWVEHEAAMKRKTAVRRLVDWVPQSAELMSAVEQDTQDTVTQEKVRTVDNRPPNGNGGGQAIEFDMGQITGDAGAPDEDQGPGPGDTLGEAGKSAVELANEASESGDLDRPTISDLAEAHGLHADKVRRILKAAGLKPVGKVGRAAVFDAQAANAALDAVTDGKVADPDDEQDDQPGANGHRSEYEEQLVQRVLKLAAPDFTATQLLIAAQTKEPEIEALASASIKTLQWLLTNLEEDELRVRLEGLILSS